MLTTMIAVVALVVSGGGRGTLISTEGAPLAGVELRLFQSRTEYDDGSRWERVSQLGPPTVTDAEGRFTLPLDVDNQGRYYLAWADGPAAAQVSGWLTGEELLRGLRLEGIARRSVTARLTDSKGGAIVGSTVTLRSSGAKATTDVDGVFTLADVPAREEIVLVRTANASTTWGILRPLDGGSAEPAELRVEFALSAPATHPLDAGPRNGLALPLLEFALDEAIASGDPLELRAQLDALAGADLEAAFRRLDEGLLEGATRTDFLVAYNCGPASYYDPALKDGVSFDDYVRARLRTRAAPDDGAARVAREALEMPPPIWPARTEFADPLRADSSVTEAVRSLRGLPPSVLSSRAAAIAYAMAPVDSASAERIAALDPTGYALGMAALGLLQAGGEPHEAQARRQRALELLESAFQRVESGSGGPHASAHGNRYRVGVALLSVALRADPGSAHAWINRVLRIPLPSLAARRNGRTGGGAQQADAALGWMLLERCPDLSRALAFSRLPTAGCEPDLPLFDTADLWSLAATLDPESTASLARRDRGASLTYVGRAVAWTARERVRRVPRASHGLCLWTPPDAVSPR